MSEPESYCTACGVPIQQWTADVHEGLCVPCHRRSRIEGLPSLRLRFTLRTIFVLMFVTGVLIVSARWWYVGARPIAWTDIDDPRAFQHAGERPVLLLVHASVGGIHRFVVADDAVDVPVVRRLIISKSVISLRIHDCGSWRPFQDLLPEPITYPYVVVIPARGMGDPTVITSLKKSDDRIVTALRQLP